MVLVDSVVDVGAGVVVVGETDVCAAGDVIEKKIAKL